MSISVLFFFQETQERPPLDFFSAIFENQDSDEENVDEQEIEEKKNGDISKPLPTQSSITLAPAIKIPSALSISQQSHYSDQSDSSDSSIEEIAAPGKQQRRCVLYFCYHFFYKILDKSSLAYGPAIPSKLSSRPKTDNNNSSIILKSIHSVITSLFCFLLVWNKLANSDEQFEELKQKKKHKKKKKHNKKV